MTKEREPMDAGAWMSALAVLLSPIIALQISKRLDEEKEKRQRKRWVFYTLMATRNARVSAEHVRALNSIDIEFVDKKLVTDAWKAYLDHLNDSNVDAAVWIQRSDDFFVELLFAMGSTLGFGFDRTHLKRGIYSPRAHDEADQEATVVRRALVAIAKGEQALRVDLSEITESSEEEQHTATAKKMMGEVLTGVRPLLVRLDKQGPRSAGPEVQNADL